MMTIWQTRTQFWNRDVIKKDLSKFSHSVFLCVLFNYIHGDLGFHKAFTQGLKEGEVAEGFSPWHSLASPPHSKDPQVPDSWSKGCEFQSQQEWWENFLLQLTLCADSYLVSVPPPCYCSGTEKTPVILPKVQVAGYAWAHIRPWPNKVGVGWLCRCPGIEWEPVRKRGHMQLIREHSTTVISARWAIVDWSWPKQ